MKEKEVKILEINKKEIISKLEKLGAEKVFDSYYKGLSVLSPAREIDTENNLLGIRKKGDVAYLLFKGKKEEGEAKIREEIELKIEDYEKTKKIFKNLGFNFSDEKTKSRTSYILDDARFEIDTYEEIPTFLEIEAPSIESIKEAVESVGYSMEDTNSLSGQDIFEKYGKKW